MSLGTFVLEGGAGSVEAGEEPRRPLTTLKHCNITRDIITCSLNCDCLYQFQSNWASCIISGSLPLTDYRSTYQRPVVILMSPVRTTQRCPLPADSCKDSTPWAGAAPCPAAQTAGPLAAAAGCLSPHTTCRPAVAALQGAGQAGVSRMRD